MHRTFPDHPFYASADGKARLARVLLAFSVLNPVVGYLPPPSAAAGATRRIHVVPPPQVLPRAQLYHRHAAALYGRGGGVLDAVRPETQQRAGTRPHLRRDSATFAPGLGHICAGTRPHLRGDSATSALGLSAGARSSRICCLATTPPT
jgi:hypothetical protein